MKVGLHKFASALLVTPEQRTRVWRTRNVGTYRRELFGDADDAVRVAALVNGRQPFPFRMPGTQPAPALRMQWRSDSLRLLRIRWITCPRTTTGKTPEHATVKKSAIRRSSKSDLVHVRRMCACKHTARPSRESQSSSWRAGVASHLRRSAHYSRVIPVYLGNGRCSEDSAHEPSADETSPGRVRQEKPE